MGVKYNFLTGEWEDSPDTQSSWADFITPTEGVSTADYLQSLSGEDTSIYDMFLTDDSGNVDWNSDFWSGVTGFDGQNLQGDAGAAVADIFGFDLPSWEAIFPGTGGGGNAGVSASWLSDMKKLLGIGAGNEGGLFGGASGSDALLGANGVLGVLAALSARPSTSTQTGSSGTTGATSSSTNIADWFDTLQQGLGTTLSAGDGSWSDLSGYLAGGTGQFTDLDPTELASYMNPYVNSVLTPQLTRMSEDFLRGENARQAKAGMVGAFGGERDLIERNLAGERYDKAVNEATANAYSNAFTNAQAMFGQDRSAQQWGANATANLFGLLKPETSTSSTTETTTSNSAKITGTDPNTFGQLANVAGQMYNLANPPVVRT